MIEYTLRKEIILKGNTTRYIEYNHKNTGTSCTSVRKFRLQCFDLSTKCLKTVSLNLTLDFLLKFEVDYPG